MTATSRCSPRHSPSSELDHRPGTLFSARAGVGSQPRVLAVCQSAGHTEVAPLLLPFRRLIGLTRRMGLTQSERQLMQALQGVLIRVAADLRCAASLPSIPLSRPSPRRLRSRPGRSPPVIWASPSVPGLGETPVVKVGGVNTLQGEMGPTKSDDDRA